MGLMFPMPVSEDETDFVTFPKTGGIVLKSYGLPPIFWGYLAGFFGLLALLSTAIQRPLLKIMASPNAFDALLGYCSALLLLAIPTISLCFYFYEKSIVKKGRSLVVGHKIFWIPVRTKTYTLPLRPRPFVVDHRLDSPNMAKIRPRTSMRAFQNQGYYVLSFFDEAENKIDLDRHSRRADLKKLAALLERF